MSIFAFKLRRYGRYTEIQADTTTTLHFFSGDLPKEEFSFFQPVTVPGKDGTALVCRVGDLRVKNEGAETVSFEEDEQISIGLWKPAPIKDDVAHGLVEWFDTEQPFDRLDLLRRHPSLYLHKDSVHRGLMPGVLRLDR